MICKISLRYNFTCACSKKEVDRINRKIAKEKGVTTFIIRLF